MDVTVNTRLPPPVILLFAVAAVWGIDWLAPATRFEAPWLTPMAVTLAAAAAGVMLAAALWFARQKTTLNPMHPERARHLLTTGPYAVSRNPIYLADAALLLGWALWLGNAAGLLMVPVFIRTLNRLQIEPEEQALAHKFGEAYRDYCRRVRRWL